MYDQHMKEDNKFGSQTNMLAHNVITKTELSEVLDDTNNTNAKNPQCKYKLIKNNSYDEYEDKLLEFIYSYLPKLVLKYERYSKKVPENKRDQYKKEIMKEVARKFKGVIEKKENIGKDVSKTTGELGEIILCLLLESENITLIYNKLRLKTSPGINVGGYDAVHVEIDDNDHLIFHFGESKMTKATTYTKVVKEAIQSIDVSSSQYDLELDLIRDQIDMGRYSKKLSDEIIEYVDPLSDKTIEHKSYPIFIGWNWEFLKKNNDISTIIKEYKKFEITCTEYLQVEASNINKIIQFYMLPFRDIDRVRKQFLDMLRKELIHDS